VCESCVGVTSSSAMREEGDGMSDGLEDLARQLYEAWRGGKADWSKLTPENKARWLRCSSKAWQLISR